MVHKKRRKIVYLIASCRRCGPTKVIENIIRNIDNEQFEPILITLHEEGSDSLKDDMIKCVRLYLRTFFLEETLERKITPVAVRQNLFRTE